MTVEHDPIRPVAVVILAAGKLNEGDEDKDEGDGQRADPFRFFFHQQQQRDPRRQPNPAPSIGEGSGFIISEDGYILTNNHVVEDADNIKIGLSDGNEYEARVIGTDPSIDIALLKIDVGESLPSLALGDSGALRVGQWVIAIGNPLEYEHTVTVGVVSAKERRVPIGSTDQGVVSFIQTDAAINFGNSGGPLLDANGNVIGINTAIRRANYAEGIGFALPINHARVAMEQLREKGYVTRGFIGISMNQQGVDREAAEFYGLPDTRGVIIQKVTDGGPAAHAGLRKEDIIRKVNGETIKDNLDLIGKISMHQPGDEVHLEVFRAGETLQLTATLGSRREGLLAQTGGRVPERREPEVELEESTGMGITVETLNDSMRERLGLSEEDYGVLVTSVEYDSEASNKGIRRNMVIVDINDFPVRNVRDWEEVLSALSPGSPAKINAVFGNQGGYFFLRVPNS